MLSSSLQMRQSFTVASTHDCAHAAHYFHAVMKVLNTPACGASHLLFQPLRNYSFSLILPNPCFSTPLGLRQMVRLEGVLAAPEALDLAPLLLRHEARSLRDLRTLLAPLVSCMEACANPGAPVARAGLRASFLSLQCRSALFLRSRRVRVVPRGYAGTCCGFVWIRNSIMYMWSVKSGPAYRVLCRTQAPPESMRPRPVHC